MSVIRATFTNGQIVPDSPVDWPDGTRLEIQPVESTEWVGVGIREEDWPTTPEGVDEWIAWYDSLQPSMTPEDEAEWKKALAEQKAFDLSKWEERCRKIERLLE